jgi:hypothetical protein
VLDYEIIHEHAHLAVPDHGPRFQALVARYPRAERAVGFLIAKDLAPDNSDVDDDPEVVADASVAEEGPTAVADAAL